MSDEEYEQATPQQKLNIASYILQSSPTGEVHDVLVDVAKLVGDSSVLSDGKVKSYMKSYNEKEYQPIKLADGSKVCITPFGAVGEDEYLDPSSGKVFKVDHRKHAYVSDSDKQQSLDSAIGAYRTAIQTAMGAYSESNYKKDKCTITVYGADDGTITICLSARNVNLSSYWGGGWRSTITLNVKTKGSTELKCATKVNVHYFEDGNVQLHAAVDKTASIKVADEKATADAIAAAVKTIESDFQTAMEEMYVDMHHTTFKAMRRFLPITKQPMKWSEYAHSIVQGK